MKESIEKNKIIVENLSVFQREDLIEMSAAITALDLDWKKEKLWFRFPKKLSAYVPVSFDPFLAALLPLAIKKNSDLILNGEVSEQLLAHSGQIIKIFNKWFKEMHSVSIRAASTASHCYGAEAVGSFFTGGVDSFYTVLKNLSFYQGESKISHLLYVHGFDIPIDNHKLFEDVKNKIVSAADDLHLEPIFIQTNLRQFTDQYVRWGEEQHSASLASAALSLSGFFKIVYIPSSVAFSELYQWGSHPFLDPLWSNERLHFIHDGNEAKRSQKTLWQLSKSEVALKYLRVCWKNPDNEYNCGKCGKCIRTKINLKIAGVLEKCQTLDNNIDFNIYENILLKSFVEMRNLKENIALIEDDSPFKNKLQGLLEKVESKQKRLDYRMKKMLRKFSNYF